VNVHRGREGNDTFLAAEGTLGVKNSKENLLIMTQYEPDFVTKI
jgi:hypothetical protein